MSTVEGWLASFGMSEYAGLFAANRIDYAVLSDLTDDDLEKLGIVFGDRRKILRAIRALPEAIETAQPRRRMDLAFVRCRRASSIVSNVRGSRLLD